MTKPSARQPSRQRPRRCAGQLGPGHRVDGHQPGLQRSRRHLSRHPPRLRTSRRIHQASDNHLSTREPPAQPAAMAARPPRAGRRALPPPRGRAASGGRLDGEGDPVRQPRRRGLAQHLRRLAACPASRTVRQHRSHTSRCSSTAAPPRDPAPRPGTPSAAGHGSHDCPCATPASASNWASQRLPGAPGPAPCPAGTLGPPPPPARCTRSRPPAQCTPAAAPAATPGTGTPSPRPGRRSPHPPRPPRPPHHLRGTTTAPPAGRGWAPPTGAAAGGAPATGPRSGRSGPATPACSRPAGAKCRQPNPA